MKKSGKLAPHERKRLSRWRTKLFGPKILRIRRSTLVRRNVSDVLQVLRSPEELTQTFRYLFFRREGDAPWPNVSLFARADSGLKGVDLIVVRTDDGLIFRTPPDSLSAVEGEITCRAVDVITTEVRLALGFISPMTGVRALAATFMKPALDQLVWEELRRLKQFLETGEVAKAA